MDSSVKSRNFNKSNPLEDTIALVENADNLERACNASAPPMYSSRDPNSTQQFSPPLNQTAVTQQPKMPVAANNITIVTQPTVIGRTPGVKFNQWTSGVCNCFEDMHTCICGWFCMPCLMSSISQRFGEHMCAPCCIPNFPMQMRTAIRERHSIQGSMMDDCCTVACCTPCSVCQMDRELKRLGYRKNGCCCC